MPELDTSGRAACRGLVYGNQLTLSEFTHLTVGDHPDPNGHRNAPKK